MKTTTAVAMANDAPAVSSPDRVGVTQADRDAAEAFWTAYCGNNPRAWLGLSYSAKSETVLHFARHRLAALPTTPPAADAGEVAALVERLKKRAEEDRACAENSRVVLALLQPQLDAFNERYANGGTHNTYAVRMAVDHKNSVRRDTTYAEDLEAAIAALAPRDHGETPHAR